MDDYAGQFEQDFFQDTKIIDLELGILNDLWINLQSEFAMNGWTVEEGLRYTLAAGLAVLQAERQRQELEGKPEAVLRTELDRLQRERMLVDGRYAVMKFRTYQFMQDAKILAMKLDVCQAQLEGLRQVNEQLRSKSDRDKDI